MKPIEELLEIVSPESNRKKAASLLHVHIGFVEQWFPRERILPNGKKIVEQGVEPSAGFIACALAILRNQLK